MTDWPRTTATQSKLYSYTAEYHRVANQPALRPCHTARQLSRLHCHSHTRPVSTAHQHRRTAWSTVTHNICVTTSRYTLRLLLQPSPQLSLQWRSVSAVDAAYMFNTSQCTIDRLHPDSHTDTHTQKQNLHRITLDNGHITRKDGNRKGDHVWNGVWPLSLRQ